MKLKDDRCQRTGSHDPEDLVGGIRTYGIDGFTEPNDHPNG